MSTVSYRDFTGTAAENYQRYFVPAIATPVSADLLAGRPPAAWRARPRRRMRHRRHRPAGRRSRRTDGLGDRHRHRPRHDRRCARHAGAGRACHRLARRRRNHPAVPRRLLRRRTVPDGTDVHGRPSRRRHRDAPCARPRWPGRRQHARHHPAAVRDHGARHRRAHQHRPRRLRARRLLDARPRTPWPRCCAAPACET